MTDIVERLRVEGFAVAASTAYEAANEIERLREYLRVYGGHIPSCHGRPCTCGFQRVFDEARASISASVAMHCTQKDGECIDTNATVRAQRVNL